MLRGVGAAGAVGIAAAVGAGAASGVAAAAPRPAAGHRDAAAERPSERSSGQAGAPLVVYLRDAAAGELELFAGTSRTVVVDRDLAARLARAVR